jgi:hypothetical protein
MSIMTGPEAGERKKRAPNRAPTFLHRDLKEAIKAARAAGLDMEKYRVEVDKAGTISLVPVAPDESAEPKGANEWDEVLKKDD